MALSRPDCLFIEGCDFEQYPPGGQLSFAKLMMTAYGNRLALVGTSTDDTPLGRWVEREFDGRRFLFFSVHRRSPSAEKPVIPARLSFFAYLSRWRAGVLSLGVRSAFLQAPEGLMAVARWGMESICYRFAGVENPVAMSRYPWTRLLKRSFDQHLFSALEKTSVILASADGPAIEGLVARSRSRLPRDRISHFSTYFDSTVFKATPREDARRELGIDGARLVLVSSGRVSQVKGWDLLLASLQRILRTHPDALLAFVGDGEDRPALLAEAARLGVSEHVQVTGFLPPPRVAAWLNAADAVLVGSHREGWSISMLEALGCGKALVSTDVSGAREMIREGQNGFVVTSRSPDDYAATIVRALALPEARATSLGLATRYDIHQMTSRISSLWKVLA